jgi:hypothetical protein
MLLGTGCSSSNKVAPPPPGLMNADTLVDVGASSTKLPNVEKDATEALLASHKTPVASPGTKSWNVLALSGAGQFAAFAGGILVEWRNRGDCPDFDVYTGISSGAIVATLGCLGPKYHEKLEHLLTSLKYKELFSLRPLPINILKRKALANPKGVVEILETTLDEEMLSDLAAMHQSGKRLYIGTMSLNSRRLVVWDIGAIASSQQPDRLCLVRKVLLASCSIPGFVPPVAIKVRVDGVEYEELHGDAGAIAQTFIRFSEQTPSYDPNHPGKPWLAGSNLYIIAGGKLYANPLEPNPGFLTLATSTISATLYGLFRADLWRLYSYCAVSGMKFHFTHVPDDFDLPSSSIKFNPDTERKLFDNGRDFIRCKKPWRLTPPGVDTGEGEVPRSGVEFRNGACVK